MKRREKRARNCRTLKEIDCVDIDGPENPETNF